MSVVTGVVAALTLATVGLVAGLLFAFSVAVMRGLDDAPAERAIEVMQYFNRRIQNPVFFTCFLGAPILGAATGLLLYLQDQSKAAGAILTSVVIYVVGVIGPTAIVNVPENNKIDAVPTSPAPEDAGRIWSAYSTRWTRWNTVRTVLGTLSLLLIGYGFYLWGRG